MNRMQSAPTAKRQLGNSDLWVTPVSLGCWPIAGMTSTHVNDVDSLATLQAALDSGINFLDTAFGYGQNGESEKLIAQATKHRSDHVIIASKVGMGWDDQPVRVFDASPANIKQQCETCLQRLQRDCIDLLYLHAPDGKTPLQESAQAFVELIEQGKIRFAGVSNLNVEQLQQFASVCPIAAVQDYFNMLQQIDRREVIRWCQANNSAFVAYWPLMKGLLAGQLPRDFQFSETDSRRNYQQFQGQQWQENQNLVDGLRALSNRINKSVTEIVVQWTFRQPGITSVLCGAKRANQIWESATAMHWELSEHCMQEIDQLIDTRMATERQNQSADND